MGAVYQVGQREGALNQIARVLQVGTTLYGLKNEQIKTDALAAEQKRIASGQLTPKEQIEYGQHYNFSDQQTAGAFHAKNPEGNDIWLSPKDSKPSALSQLEFTKQLGDGFKEVPSGAPGSILVSHVGPDGKVTQSSLMPPDKSKTATPDQSKAALFGKRMEQAEGVFGELGAKGFDATTLGSASQRSFLFPENMKSENSKRQDQAERNFVNAILRRESGSAIAPSEFSSAEKQYFPRAGDTPEVLKQKAENRALAVQGMQSEAGPAWQGVSVAKAKETVAAKGGGRKDLVNSAYANQPPKPGAIQDGWLFNGGDPSKKENWKKVSR